MKRLRFEGYSDDTFGEYGVTNIDHDDCATSTHRAFRVSSGTDAVVVVGVHAPKGTPGAWMIGIQMDNQDGDFGGALPAWPIRFVRADRPYTPALEIDAPDDVVVELLIDKKGGG